MEELAQQLVESGDIPGVVLLAKDKHGKLDYAQSHGVRSLKDPSPMTPDTVMRLASASKLITSVMCLQCAQQGLLNLDDDVSPLLPEVAKFEILTGFDADGKPETRRREKPLTLRHVSFTNGSVILPLLTEQRHLLSHSSGISYAGFDPLLIKYRRYQGLPLVPPGDKIEHLFTYPLTFEPGEGWMYGPNLEWIGRLIENVNDGRPLEDIMQEFICRPLGITDMTFRLQQRPGLIAIRSDMSVRGEDGQVRHSDETYWHHDPIDAMGGMGIYTSPASYMKILHSVLLDDGKLLNSHWNNILFQPALTPPATQSLMQTLAGEEMNTKMGALLPMGVKKDYALGGMIVEEDLDGQKWLSKGTMVWSGLPNIYWFIDRAAGLCGLYASQLKPPGDAKSVELARAFEREMYARLRA